MVSKHGLREQTVSMTRSTLAADCPVMALSRERKYSTLLCEGTRGVCVFFWQGGFCLQKPLVNARRSKPSPSPSARASGRAGGRATRRIILFFPFPQSTHQPPAEAQEQRQARMRRDPVSQLRPEKTLWRDGSSGRVVGHGRSRQGISQPGRQADDKQAEEHKKRVSRGIILT